MKLNEKKLSFTSGERICYDSHKHRRVSLFAVMPSAAFCSLGVSLAFSWVSVCTKSICRVLKSTMRKTHGAGFKEIGLHRLKGLVPS